MYINIVYFERQVFVFNFEIHAETALFLSFQNIIVVCLSVCMPNCFFESVCLFVCVSVRSSARPSVRLSVWDERKAAEGRLFTNINN